MSKDMDCCTPEASTTQSRSTRTTPDLIRSALRDRRVLMIGGMVVIAGALALNWSWLTAIGAASIILALAPCAVMCALGMCMMAKKSAPNQAHQSTTEMAPLPKAAEPSQLTAGGERQVTYRSEDRHDPVEG